MCRRNRTIILCICCTMCAGGCQSFKRLFKKPPPKFDPVPPATQIVVSEPIRAVDEQRPVKVGSLPLVYLLEQPGEVRVIDATAGTVVVGTQAGGRTILSVTADKGVSIAGRTIRAGPLDPTHRYEIYLISPGENAWKNVYQRR